LLHCKEQNIPIVGFSASPIRSSKQDRERLSSIYASSSDKQLNLLTNYNMMYAINQKLILPPEFHWYNIDSYNKIKKEDNNNNEITEKDIISVLTLLNSITTKMIHKKIIAWRGTIIMSNK